MAERHLHRYRTTGDGLGQLARVGPTATSPSGKAVHVFPENGDPFFEAIQEVYDEIGEGRPAGTVLPRPGELGDRRDEIEASGLFELVELRHYDWEQTYNAEDYIDLLNTFSGHLAMEKWQRDRLYGEIRRRLAQRPDRRLRRQWGGVLHIARRS